MREAIGQYQAALALGPEFHDLRYKLGRLLLQAGRVLEAREQFEIIVRSPLPETGVAKTSLRPDSSDVYAT